MVKRLELAGKTFGRLTVKEYLGGSKWLCLCKCGNQKKAITGNLTGGKTKSCGCMKLEQDKGFGGRLDLRGMTFGSLTAVKDVGINKHGSSLWLCLCKCGKEREFVGHELKRGNYSSCGCMHHVPHEMAGTGAYKSWSAMKSRCLNKNQNTYKQYGGLGIEICDRWIGDDGFKNFFNDMGQRPEGKSLDRIDPSGNYEPENCRWASDLVQARNTKRAKMLSGVMLLDSGKWQAKIDVDRERIHLGSFSSFLEAASARKSAENKYWGNER